jgi:hypothetical protein
MSRPATASPRPLPNQLRRVMPRGMFTVDSAACVWLEEVLRALVKCCMEAWVAKSKPVCTALSRGMFIADSADVCATLAHAFARHFQITLTQETLP